MGTRTLKDETRPHTGCERLTALFEHDRPPVHFPTRTDCRVKLPFASVGEPLIAALRQELADVPQRRIAVVPCLMQRDGVARAVHRAHPRVVAVKVDDIAVDLVNARLAVEPLLIAVHGLKLP